MSEFKIEKGIPLPGGALRKGRQSIYPFDELEIGDSFFIPCPNKLKAWQKSSTVDYFNKKLSPKAFTRRAYDDGVRIWRIE